MNTETKTQTENATDKYADTWIHGNRSSIDSYYENQVYKLAIKRMKKALDFYANLETYKMKCRELPEKKVKGFIADIDLDCGTVAREAIEFLDKRIIE